MRAVVQRVSSASVSVAGEVVGSIGVGLCVLVGVTHSDGQVEAQKLAKKIHGLRVFDDDAGVMNLSLDQVGGSILVVSQFTLYGDVSKGRRPTWTNAARPDHAEPLVEAFVSELRVLGAEVDTGVFGADMSVALVNDGPSTLLVEV
ncbi:MAG: D-aminoacyl-tRNA deacylase [Acidimicrobiales bacterium]